MPIQTATTGNLDDAQAIIIAEARFTAEHSAPCSKLIERFTLGQGEKQMTVPKVGQMTAQPLTDGVDLVSSQAIGMNTTDLYASEVGMKVIITDKLARQEKPDVWRMVGRQMGDGMERKRDEDIIALFSGLNAGVTLGVAACDMHVDNVMGCIARMQARPAPKPWYIVHHPNAIFVAAKDVSAVAATGYGGLMQGVSEAVFKNFWKLTVGGVPIFEDGNINVVTGESYGYGAIFSRGAMCIIESQAQKTERERDASLRATELVITSDYGVFELDETYGFPMMYLMSAASTTATS